jgi:hypothetical protein
MSIDMSDEYFFTKIVSNKAKCKTCGDVIESKHVHDYVNCKCGAIAVDGGKDYLKRAGILDDIIELSETRIFTEYEFDDFIKTRDKYMSLGLTESAKYFKNLYYPGS